VIKTSELVCCFEFGPLITTWMVERRPSSV
jgi:hypothetical protein